MPPYSSPAEQLMSTLYPIFTAHVKTVAYMPRSDSNHFYSSCPISKSPLLSKFSQFVTLLLKSSQNTTSSAHGQSVHHIILLEYYISWPRSVSTASLRPMASPNITSNIHVESAHHLYCPCPLSLLALLAM